MNCFHYTPGYLSLSRKNLSWHKNNFHSFPHISLLSTLALLKNWGIVFLPAAPRPAFSSNHTPQSVGRKLTTLRAHYIRIVGVEGSNPFRSTMDQKRRSKNCGAFGLITWRVLLTQGVPALFVFCHADCKWRSVQNSCPGSFNFSLGGKSRSNTSAAVSST